MTKMQQELQKNITRELKEAAAEFEAESYRPPLGSRIKYKYDCYEDQKGSFLTKP